MDKIPENIGDYNKFALPLYLLSLSFFSMYFIIIIWFFTGTLRSVLEFLLPSSTATLVAGYSPVMCGIGIFLLSFIGVLLLFRVMQTESFPTKNALLLIIVFCVVIISMVLSVVIPIVEVQKILGNLFLLGFTLVPLGVSYLLRDLEQSGSDTSGIRSIQHFTTAVGHFGFFIALLVVYSTLTYVPPQHYDVFDIDLLHLLEIFLGAIYLIFLMPAAGVKIARLGLKFRKIPLGIKEKKEQDHDGAKSPENTPAGKCLPDHLPPAAPTWLTDKRRRAVIFIVVGILVIAGIFFIWGVIDTTPGKTWVQVTTSAPFGSKGGFVTAEYQGQLWLIGGTGKTEPYGEAWHTSDGAIWVRESSPQMVPQRMGASSAVFNDALWVIGGVTEQGYIQNNDVWYTSNGITWLEIQPAAEFSPRSGHSTVVFNDRIWVIGGNIANPTDHFTSDVWYSSNGISWERATPAGEFSPRSGHSSFVYDNKIWVIGGRDSTGNLNDVWNSADGVHWTQVTASAAFAKDTPYNVVIFDKRMWVIQNFIGTNGIWYSTDGATWSKLMSSPQFFQEEYCGGAPRAIVFDNRLWIFQSHNLETGIWYTMQGGPSSCRPSAYFIADKSNGPAPLEIKFSDASLCRPDEWEWDFGDGSQSSEQNPQHTFTSPGNYSVRLTAKNNLGESSQSLNITIFKSVSLSTINAGKDWKLATNKVPYGTRESYSVVVWNDSMWVIAGTKAGGTPQYNDIWYSRDGSHWIQVTKNAAFEARSQHSTAVFNDKLWMIGGVVDHIDDTGWHIDERKNDVWYSTDGAIWTLATPAAQFPPQQDHRSIAFNDRLWVFGEDTTFWSSPDGITWNQSPSLSVSSGSRSYLVIKDNRIWRLQDNWGGGLWNTADGITGTLTPAPPFDQEIYSIYTDSLVVYDNKLWLFRALEKREGDNALHGELWVSDDGYNWVLITDAVPFADGARALNDFHLISFDNKLWAFMVKGTSIPFSKSWDWNAEIWYSDLE